MSRVLDSDVTRGDDRPIRRVDSVEGKAVRRVGHRPQRAPVPGEGAALSDAIQDDNCGIERTHGGDFVDGRIANYRVVEKGSVESHSSTVSCCTSRHELAENRTRLRIHRAGPGNTRADQESDRWDQQTES